MSSELIPSVDAGNYAHLQTKQTEMWGVPIHAGKIISVSDVPRLVSDEAVVAPPIRNQLIAHNPWADVVEKMGGRVILEPSIIPVEEGETSLNVNTHQALMALSVIASGVEGGIHVPVFGNMAFGNHSFQHTLDVMWHSFPHPGGRALMEQTFGPSALESIAQIIGALGRDEKQFQRLKHAVQQKRALRFPANVIQVPSADAVLGMYDVLGVSDLLLQRIGEVYQQMIEEGLSTVGDFILLLRTTLMRDLFLLMGYDEPIGLIPVSLEFLVMNTTSHWVDRPIAEIVADYQQVWNNYSNGQHVVSKGNGRYRVGNYYDSHQLLLGGKSLRSFQLEHAWERLEASYNDGTLAVRTGIDLDGLGEMPVREFLDRGFGVSGKLVYMMVREVNHQRVANLVRRELPDVFAALADPSRPNYVIPTGRVIVNGDWQKVVEPLDLLMFMNWIYSSPDPKGTAIRIFSAYRTHAVNWRSGQEVRIILGTPGEFTINYDTYA